jgi:XcyI restriction endonuclease
VKTATVSFNESQITVKNAAGRTVYVEFAPDPDIVIREEIAPASFAEKIAIEVKAGKDFSNVHNRIGEAEKSHQKARSRGFVECWTVLNVARLDTANGTPGIAFHQSVLSASERPCGSRHRVYRFSKPRNLADWYKALS